MLRKMFFTIFVCLFCAKGSFAQESLTIEQKLAKVEDEEYECTFEFLDEVEAELKGLGYVKDDIAFAKILNRRGLLFFEDNSDNNSLDKAIDCWKETLVIAEKAESGIKFISHVKLCIAFAYNIKAEKLAKAENYAQALPYAEEAAKIYKELFGAKYERTQEMFFRVGLLYYTLGFDFYFKYEWNSAATYFEKAISFYEDSSKADVKNLLEAYKYAAESFYMDDKYSKALPFYEKTAKIQEEIFGENHPDIAEIYDKIGHLYSLKDDDDNAIFYYKKELQVYESNSIENENVAKCYSRMGDVYKYKTDYNNALVCYEHAIEIYNRIPNPNISEIVLTYKGFALLKYELGQYEDSLNYYHKSLEICKQNGLENADMAASIFGQMSNVLTDLSRYAEALNCAKTQIEILKKNKGKEYSVSEELITSSAYQNLAMIYTKMENYDSALEYFFKALEIAEKLENKTKDSEFDLSGCATEILGNIGLVYLKKADYDNAIKYTKNSLDDLIKLPGENQLNIGLAYSNLGTIYMEKRDWDQSVNCFENSREILEKVFGEEHPASVAVYNNIACVYLNKHDFDRALAYFNKALYVNEKISGDGDAVASNCVNIGIVYAGKEDYDNSMLYSENALEIYKKIFGSDANTAGIAMAYSNIGYVCQKKGDLVSATQNYAKAIEVLEKVVAEPTPELARYWANFAEVEGYSKDNYEKSVELFGKAINVFETFFGQNYADTVLAYYYLGELHNRWGNAEKALECWRKAVGAIKSSSIDYESVLEFGEDVICADISDDKFKQQVIDLCIKKTEDTRFEMSSLKTNIMEKALPFYYFGVHFEAEQKNFARAFEYSESLRSRGFLDQIGTAAALRLDGIKDEDREKIINLSNIIESSRQNITSRFSVPNENRNAEFFFKEEQRLSNAEKELNKLDKELAKKNPKYASLRNPKIATVKDAQKWCGKKRAILEYVICDTSNMPANIKNLGIGSYCIVITSKKVSAVRLESNFDYTTEIERLIGSEKERKGITSNMVKPVAENRFESSRNNLYEHLIKPILPFIEKSVGELVIVPDGNLSRLPFDILRENEKSKMLGEKYAVAFSPSISVSIVASKIRNNNDKMLAIGAAWYDSLLTEDGHRLALSGGEYKTKTIYPKDLPGTAKEIKTLQEKIFKNRPLDTILQQNATERNIRELSQNGSLRQYSNLLFAGHGEYNTEDSGKSAILFSEICGLFPVDSTVEFGSNNLIDGYLCIEEAAILNLNAEGLVLSACETGLGEVKGGDGFVGLTRAFMVAGCKNVGASLWKIDDEATSEFMARMYTHVKSGRSYVEAYKAAKDAMRKSEEFSHPYYWAPFVLYE